MPNRLMYVWVQQCTVRHVDVESSSSGHGTYRLYLVEGHRDWEWHCQCTGFLRRGRCRHQAEAARLFCGYLEQVDGPPETDGVCPKCGAPTEKVMVAV